MWIKKYKHGAPGPLLTPAQTDLVLRTNLANAAGFFDGSARKTITKTNTVTSEYQCFFKAPIYALSPDNIEIIYSISGTSNFYIDNNRNVFFGFDGDNHNFGKILLKQEQTLELYIKGDAVKVIRAGVEVERTGLSLLGETWNSYHVGGQLNGLFGFTGLIPWHADCDERWQGTDLLGSLDTLAALTDPNVLYDTRWVAKDIRNTLYMILVNSASALDPGTLIEPNPTGNATLLSLYGKDSGETLTSAEYVALRDNSQIFIDSAGNRNLTYSSAQTGASQDIAKRLTHAA
jgi:hypothetical protein